METIFARFNPLREGAFELILTFILLPGHHFIIDHLHLCHRHHLRLPIQLMANSNPINIQMEMVKPAQSVVLPLISHLLELHPHLHLHHHRHRHRHHRVTLHIPLACE